jgi:ADP-ribose pyrophosphatase
MQKPSPPIGKETVLRTERFEVERVRRALPDGGSLDRSVVRHPGAVTILPLLEGDRVCLIQNWRVAVEKTLIELPAGTLAPGEDPRETAFRELIEETGFRAGCLEPLSACYMSPGILDERMYLFVARDLTPGSPAREAGEEIENLIVPWQDAIRMVRDGRIEDAKTMIGLLVWEQQRERSGRS